MSRISFLFILPRTPALPPLGLSPDAPFPERDSINQMHYFRNIHSSNYYEFYLIKKGLPLEVQADHLRAIRQKTNECKIIEIVPVCNSLIFGIVFTLR